MSNELDVLLSKPLTEIADGGFTDGVMSRIVKRRARAARNEAILLSAVAASVCLMLSFTQVGRVVNDWAVQMGDTLSVPVAAAVGALLLARFVAQMLPD
jgi:hypothetical protein